MRRAPLIGYLRAGDAGAALAITLMLSAGEGVVGAQLGASARTIALAAVFAVPLTFLAIWLATAKIAHDLAAVHALNVGAAERRRAIASAIPAPAFYCSIEELADIADAEMDALPVWLKDAVARNDVAVAVEDEREGEPLVLGVYHRSMGMSQIVLYRQPILRAAADRQHVREVVHGTLLHELGHLFGMSERDLDEYTIGNNPRPGAMPVRPVEPPDA